MNLTIQSDLQALDHDESNLKHLAHRLEVFKIRHIVQNWTRTNTPPSHKNMMSFLFNSSHNNMHFLTVESLFYLMRHDSFSANNTLITFFSLPRSYFINFTLKLVPIHTRVCKKFVNFCLESLNQDIENLKSVVISYGDQTVTPNIWNIWRMDHHTECMWKCTVYLLTLIIKEHELCMPLPMPQLIHFYIYHFLIFAADHNCCILIPLLLHLPYLYFYNLNFNY